MPKPAPPWTDAFDPPFPWRSNTGEPEMLTTGNNITKAIKVGPLQEFIDEARNQGWNPVNIVAAISQFCRGYRGPLMADLTLQMLSDGTVTVLEDCDICASTNPDHRI